MLTARPPSAYTDAMTYTTSAGYSMIDHQLDPLIDVAFQWVCDPYRPTQPDEDRKQTAEDLSETLEAAAAYIRAMGQRPAPLEIDCLTCGASAGDSCWTTEDEGRARVAGMSDADLIDHWG